VARSPPRVVVDRVLLAAKMAAVRDAVVRIGSVLPPTVDEFLADRTAREVVTLNLFLAIQEAIALAAHWLADEGTGVPQSYGDVFTALAERGVIETDLGTRLRAAAGLRNLIAHQYGVIDFRRVYAIAAAEVGDLVRFCQQLAEHAGDSGL
jgi:uncharacterized protein YutE (UPF0331/DUF86 family)